jgi:hypothetical protein
LFVLVVAVVDVCVFVDLFWTISMLKSKILTAFVCSRAFVLMFPIPILEQYLLRRVDAHNMP